MGLGWVGLGLGCSDVVVGVGVGVGVGEVCWDMVVEGYFGHIVDSTTLHLLSSSGQICIITITIQPPILLIILTLIIILSHNNQILIKFRLINIRINRKYILHRSC